MIKIIGFFIGIIFLISCNAVEKEYFSNGKIRKEFIKERNSCLRKVNEYDSIGRLISVYYIDNNNLLDSIQVNYVDNKINSVLCYKKQLQSGISRWLYPDGTIKKMGNFQKGERVGEHIYFFENGHIERISYNIIKNGNSYINNSLVFKENGDIDFSKSIYFDLILDNDTIQFGEKLYFRTFYITNNLIRGVICDFDKNFIIKDSSDMQYFNPIESSYYEPRKLYNDTLRVIISSKSYNIDGERDSSYFFMSNTYIEKPFFVSPRPSSP